MTHELEGREYKILLDPKSVGADPAAIDAYFETRLREILCRGKTRKLEGRLRASNIRVVQFFDTKAGVLDAASYALRHRTSNKGAEITLKLRMPDYFVVAATDLQGRDDDARTSFEEDIAPLEVMARDGMVRLAEPRSIRSRFALSTKQRFKGDLARLGDAFAFYPTLARNLRNAGMGSDRETPLCAGPTVHEQVFDGPVMQFDGDVAAKLVLSFWTLSPPAVTDRVAEMSFRCPTRGGRMPGKAALAALDLFLDLQRELDVELRYASKTKVALPLRTDDWPGPRTDAAASESKR